MLEPEVHIRVDRETITEAEVTTSEGVTLALERILASSRFAKSNRLSQFLRFAVEHALQGQAGELKEYTIATEVYGRNDDFDPAVDTIVRSEARRLRRKLKEYYDTEGEGDSIVIVFRRGSYIPVYRLRSIPAKVRDSAQQEVSVGVEPFECDGSDSLARKCAFGMSDEILHHLARVTGIRVTCGSVCCCCQVTEPSEAVPNRRPAGVVIRGSVRVHDDHLRVTVRATTREGRLLWSNQVDALEGSTTLIDLQERVAIDVLARLEQTVFGPRLKSTSKSIAHAYIKASPAA